jgi:hypothetical protein
MKETQEKARVARVKAQVKAQFKEQFKEQVRVLDRGARALVRVARVKEQKQDKVQAKEARETRAKVLVKVQVKKGIRKKRLK